MVLTPLFKARLGHIFRYRNFGRLEKTISILLYARNNNFITQTYKHILFTIKFRLNLLRSLEKTKNCFANFFSNYQKNELN